MQKETDMRDQDLDDLFAIARAQAPSDDVDLMARVLADADQNLPQPFAFRSSVAVPSKTGFWATVAAIVGGKGALAGLGTATVAGLMLGFTQPTSVTALTESFFAQTPLDQVELLPGIDAILTKG